MKRSELVIHFNCGGITSSGPYLPLPEAALRVLDAIDGLLVGIAPDVFASQRRIVIRRR